jgi:hypothetical protein
VKPTNLCPRSTGIGRLSSTTKKVISYFFYQYFALRNLIFV